MNVIGQFLHLGGSYYQCVRERLTAGRTYVKEATLANIKIIDTDCQATEGVPIVFTSNNVLNFIGRNIIQDGETVLISTEEQARQYNDKHVTLRVPIHCKMEHPNLCRVCAGEEMFKTQGTISKKLTLGEDGYYSCKLGSRICKSTADANFKSHPPYEFEVRTQVTPSEFGHPSIDHLNDRVKIKRITRIDPSRVCCLLADVMLDMTDIVDDKIAVIGKFKPTGPASNTLKQKLDEGLVPVFGMRTIKPYDKTIIITFDVIGFE